jgi:hypothetical protein
LSGCSNLEILLINSDEVLQTKVLDFSGSSATSISKESFCSVHIALFEN